MSKEIVRSESAVSYGVGLLVIFFVVFTTFVIVITPVVNALNTFSNDQIADGDMSAQRKSAHDFIDTMWTGAPVFFVLACVAWGIIRALESRGE